MIRSRPNVAKGVPRLSWRPWRSWRFYFEKEASVLRLIRRRHTASSYFHRPHDRQSFASPLDSKLQLYLARATNLKGSYLSETRCGYAITLRVGLPRMPVENIEYIGPEPGSHSLSD